MSDSLIHDLFTLFLLTGSLSMALGQFMRWLSTQPRSRGQDIIFSILTLSVSVCVEGALLGLFVSWLFSPVSSVMFILNPLFGAFVCWLGRTTNAV